MTRFAALRHKFKGGVTFSWSKCLNVLSTRVLFHVLSDDGFSVAIWAGCKYKEHL